MSPAACAEAPSADVLVVDDDVGVRSSTADILRRAGYHVEEAADGKEALELLADHQVGTILLDLRMPRLDGYGLMGALADPPPIVVVSAHRVGEADRVRLVPQVVSVLTKPVSPTTLLERVAAALHRGGGA
jgi:DNA-binding response OmpR family regulator